MTPPDDELMRLWQQGASSAPDASEVARLAARASMRRFDRLIARRNVIESVAAGGVLAFFAWRLVDGHDRLADALSSGCVVFVIAYLWWSHRHTAVVDAAADAQAYRAALLVRLDRQVSLLRTARYWYLLPLFVPPVLQGLALWEKSRSAAIVWLLVVTAIYVGIGALNERVGVTRLLAERAQLEALYRE